MGNDGHTGNRDHHLVLAKPDPLSGSHHHHHPVNHEPRVIFRP
jgi:hypothetical protein